MVVTPWGGVIFARDLQVAILSRLPRPNTHICAFRSLLPHSPPVPLFPVMPMMPGNMPFMPIPMQMPPPQPGIPASTSPPLGIGPGSAPGPLPSSDKPSGAQRLSVIGGSNTLSTPTVVGGRKGKTKTKTRQHKTAQNKKCVPYIFPSVFVMLS
jgi:hypothetical protein